MWRSFLVSCRYSFNCWSESLRPNHVFHQNRNGIRQISQAVRKKRSFCVRDMPVLRVGAASVCETACGLADIWTESTTIYNLFHYIRVEHAILLQVMRNRVLRQKRRQHPDFGSDPFAFSMGRIGRMFAAPAAAKLWSEVRALYLIERLDAAPCLVPYRSRHIDFQSHDRHN